MKQTIEIINVTKLSQFCKITGAFIPLKDLDNKSVHRYQLPTSKSSLEEIYSRCHELVAEIPHLNY